MSEIKYTYINKKPHKLETYEVEYGAGTRIRTVDLLITSQLLYQLSYAGVVKRILQNFYLYASQKVTV